MGRLLNKIAQVDHTWEKLFPQIGRWPVLKAHDERDRGQYVSDQFSQDLFL
jgi:hypothetical protein